MELNQKHTWKAEAGTISDEGIRQINALIGKQRLDADDWKLANPSKDLPHYLPNLPDDWQWVWVSTDGEFKGTFPKRVGQFYYKKHAIKCPSMLLTELGNLARNHSADDVTYTFEFVNRIDWNRGDFGDSSSCYWDSHAGARQMIEDNGGMAVRFFSADGKGIGRAWLVNVENDIRIIFNGHGFAGDPTRKIALIMAGFFGVSYRLIKLYNDGDANGVLWIDGSGKAYMIGVADVIAEHDYFELDWEEIHVYEYHCYACGEGVSEGDDYIGADDNTYCEYCYSERFSYCDKCGQTHWSEDITEVDGKYLCEYCAAKVEPPKREGKQK